MSYTINHYNGTLLTSVADGTVDTSTDLTLIGKNYAGYGQAQNDNFVWLLENFANTSQPPNPLKGQIWFDSGNSKLKFWDGTKFRTTGGAEVGATQPSGLTQGDFWFDTATNQLFAYTGTTFQLIGPQGVVGQGLTQMQSVSVKDLENGASHAIIQAVDNGNVIFIISSDGAFTLDPSVNSITGFDKIQQGVTLCYTKNADNGVTESNVNHRFWGTATNSDRLGGIPAANFLQAGNASFNTVVNFADVGYTVGSPPKLAVYNNSSTNFPTIQNLYNDTIIFQTTVSSVTKYPLTLKGNDVLPGVTLTSNIGSSTLVWNNVYATNFVGTATNANYLNLGGQFVSATTASAATSIVARDSNQNVYANTFYGTATSANYADLAEKYLPPPGVTLEAGTVVKVGGPAEICAATYGDKAIGAISTNPAFKMNESLSGGVFVALKGRVPVKVIGGCSKGDSMAPYGDGLAASMSVMFSDDDAQPICFAIALEDCTITDITLVECIIL